MKTILQRRHHHGHQRCRDGQNPNFSKRIKGWVSKVMVMVLISTMEGETMRRMTTTVKTRIMKTILLIIPSTVWSFFFVAFFRCFIILYLVFPFFFLYLITPPFFQLLHWLSVLNPELNFHQPPFSATSTFSAHFRYLYVWFRVLFEVHFLYFLLEGHKSCSFRAFENIQITYAKLLGFSDSYFRFLNYLAVNLVYITNEGRDIVYALTGIYFWILVPIRTAIRVSMLWLGVLFVCFENVLLFFLYQNHCVL